MPAKDPYEKNKKCIRIGLKVYRTVYLHLYQLQLLL